MSDNGAVAGTSAAPDNTTSRAFVWTQADGFADLGTLGGANSAAVAISNNGRFTVGYSYTTANAALDAFIWTRDEGLVDLGTGGRGASQATAVNNDGVVAGITYVPGGAFHAFAWTKADGMVDLGLGGTTSWATAVNNHGVVVGYSYLPGDTTYHAFAWTPGGGMVDLGTLGGGGSYASAVSDTGVVVGYSYLPGNTLFHAFAWTPSRGMIDLGTLGSWSIASAVSEGSVVVGTSSIAGDIPDHEGQHGFVWTSADGMADLGVLGGGRSFANAVGGNGVVVGYNETSDGTWKAFAWTRTGGMVNIEPAGSPTSSVAQAISKNGAFAAGTSGVHAMLWSLDTTAPTAVPTLGPPPNGSGWNTGRVTVSWNWEDPAFGTGVDSARCTTASTSSRMGRHTLAASCSDLAGNLGRATFIVDVDGLSPTIHVFTPADGASYVLHAARAVDYRCADQPGLSGLASCEGTIAQGGKLDTASVGIKTFTVTGVDIAGNRTTTHVTYRVRYNFRGFFHPVAHPPSVNAVKAGTAVPVTFSLGGDQGLGILAPGSPTSSEIACHHEGLRDVGWHPAGASAQSGLTFDRRSSRYTYVWQTSKDWAGTCRQLRLRLADGTEHISNYRFQAHPSSKSVAGPSPGIRRRFSAHRDQPDRDCQCVRP